MKRFFKKLAAAVTAAITVASLALSPLTGISSSATIYDGTGVTVYWKPEETVSYALGKEISGGNITQTANTHKFYVTDGTNVGLGYCAEPGLTRPTSGVTGTAAYVGDSYTLLAKVIHYGYGGGGYTESAGLKTFYDAHKDEYSGGYPALSEDLAYLITHIAVGYAYTLQKNENWGEAMANTGTSGPEDFYSKYPLIRDWLAAVGSASGGLYEASASPTSFNCNTKVTVGGIEYTISTTPVTVSGRVHFAGTDYVLLTKDSSGNYVMYASNADFSCAPTTVYPGKKTSAITDYSATDTVSITSDKVKCYAMKPEATGQTIVYGYYDTGAAQYTMTYQNTVEYKELELNKTGSVLTSVSNTADGYTFTWGSGAVPGATYQLRVYTAYTGTDGKSHATGETIATGTTDADGKTKFEKIPVSVYSSTNTDQTTQFVLSEVTAPAGYQLDATGYGLTWTKSGGWTNTAGIISSGVAKVTDSRTQTSITFGTKTDANGHPVAGAVMGVYAAEDMTLTLADKTTVTIHNGDLIRKATTDASGKVSINLSDLPYGFKWVYKEIQQPSGYTLNTSTNFYFYTNGTAQTQTGNIVDIPQLGKIKVTKSGDTLTGVTGSAGAYSFVYSNTALNGFTYDIYAAQDLNQFSDWVIANGTKIATVTTGNTSTCVSYINNAAHSISFTTDATGNIIVNGLPLGSYRVNETAGTSGYVIEGSNTVTLTGDSTGASLVATPVTTSFTDRRYTYAITMLKSDKYTSASLAGAEFTLYAKEDIKKADGTVLISANTAIEKATTGADGKATFTSDLPYGFTFYVKETKAPASHVLNSTDSVEFTTTGTTSALSGTIYDTPQYGKIKITKAGDTLTGVTGSAGAYTFVYSNTALNGFTYDIYAAQNFTSVTDWVISNGTKIATVTTGNTSTCVSYINNAAHSISFTTDATGNIVVSGLQLGSYRIDETAGQDAYVIEGSNTVTLTGDSTGAELAATPTATNFTDRRYTYSITMLKEDKYTSATLAGAEFTLYAKEDIKKADGTVLISANTAIEKATTGADGKATFTSDLPYGFTFYVKETKAPATYALNSTDKVEFTTTGTTSALSGTIYDTPQYGKIKISKSGDTLSSVTGSEGGYTFVYAAAALDGFTYDIIADQNFTSVTDWAITKDTVVATVTTGDVSACTSHIDKANHKLTFSTDATGNIIVSGLQLGSYRIEETAGQDAYVIEGSDTVTVTGDSTGTAIVATPTATNFTNRRYTFELTMLKEDMYTSATLEGAEFTLYAKEDIKKADGTVLISADTAIEKATTGADGKATFTSDLPYGFDFYVKETKAPVTYALNKTDRFEFTTTGTTSEINGTIYDSPQYGKLKVTKSGETLTGVTGSEGAYTFTYAATALDGFTYDIIADQDFVAVTDWPISKDTVIATVTTGNVSACESKVDTTEHKITFTTDKEGNIIASGLPLGSFRIVETAGQSGYVIEGSNVVEIVGDSTGLLLVNASTSFDNRRQKCSVTMTKKDLLTEVVLEGAEFTIAPAEDITLADGTVVLEKGKVIETVVTGADGKATFTTDLPYGFDYEVTETKAPTGYLLSDFSYDFVFTTDDTISDTIDMTTSNPTALNNYPVAEITLNKADADLLTGTARGSATLKGAVYGVYADGDIKKPDGTAVAHADGELVAEIVVGDADSCKAYTDETLEPLTFTSSSDVDVTVKGLYLGSYILKEITASEGYLLDEEEHKVTLSYADDKTAVISTSATSLEEVKKERFFLYKKGDDGNEGQRIIPVKDAEFNIYISSELTASDETYSIPYGAYAVHKMWATDNEEEYILVATQAEEDAAALAGYDNSEVYTMISDENGHVESGYLPYGTYLIHESEVPEDRVAGKDIVVELDGEADWWNDDKEEEDYTIYNWMIIIKKNPVKISKYDATGSNELPGATMRLYDETTGELVEEWVSTTEPHIAYGLYVGHRYRLEEVISPKGYKLATSIQFACKLDPSNEMHVVMKDNFGFRFQTGETGLNMWVCLGIAVALLMMCAAAVIVMRRKKISVKDIFRK